jgi:hypothetical protein
VGANPAAAKGKRAQASGKQRTSAADQQHVATGDRAREFGRVAGSREPAPDGRLFANLGFEVLA